MASEREPRDLRDRGAYPREEYADVPTGVGIILGEHKKAIASLEHGFAAQMGLVQQTNNHVLEMHGDVKALTSVVRDHIEQSSDGRKSLERQVDEIQRARAAEAGAAQVRDQFRKEARELAVPLKIWAVRGILVLAGAGLLFGGIAWATGRMSAPSSDDVARKAVEMYIKAHQGENP
jgi:hypothetical protein